LATGSRRTQVEQKDHTTPSSQRHSHHNFARLLAHTFKLVLLLSMTTLAHAQTLVIDINVVGLNENQSTGSTQVTQACDALGEATATELQEVCDLINSLDETDVEDVQRLEEITDAIAPEEAFAINDSLSVVSDYQTTNVHARLNALRGPAQGFAASSTSIPTGSGQDGGNSGGNNSQQQEKRPISDILNNGERSDNEDQTEQGGGSSADLVSPFGGFINGHVSNGKFDAEVLQQDSTISSSSLTVGGDYRFNKNVVAGFGVGFVQDEAKFTSVFGGSTSDGFNVTAFASWYETDQGYLDVVLDLGRANYTLERSVSINPDTSLVANSFPAATATSFTVSGGRNFKPYGFDLGGYFRLSYTGAKIDSYTESLKFEQPGFAALYSVGDQSVTSTKMVAGFNLSRSISFNRAVLLPLLRLEYVRENDEKKDAIDATLVGTETTAQYQGEDRVGGYSSLGLGATAVFSRGRSAYAFYETHLQHDVLSQNWFKTGVRLEF